MLVGSYKLVIDHRDVINDILLLRNDLAPVLTLRLTSIDSDHATTRRIQCGVEVEERAAVANKAIGCIKIVQQMHKLALALNLAEVEAIARISPLPDMQQKILAIF